MVKIGRLSSFSGSVELHINQESNISFFGHNEETDCPMIVIGINDVTDQDIMTAIIHECLEYVAHINGNRYVPSYAVENSIGEHDTCIISLTHSEFYKLIVQATPLIMEAISTIRNFRDSITITIKEKEDTNNES